MVPKKRIYDELLLSDGRIATANRKRRVRPERVINKNNEIFLLIVFDVFGCYLRPLVEER